MARGKQAVMSARRRAESAHEIIDRLTNELVEAKLRARTAEQRSAKLASADQLLRDLPQRHDELLNETMRKLRWWTKVVKEDEQRRADALEELHSRLFVDIKVAGGTIQADAADEELTGVSA